MTHRNAPAQGAPDPSVPIDILARVSRARPAPTSTITASRWRSSSPRRSSRPARRPQLVDVDYAGEPGRYDFAAGQDQAYAPQVAECRAPDRHRGGRLRRRVRRRRGHGRSALHDAVPVLPSRWSRTPAWRCRDGEDLTVYASSQIVAAARACDRQHAPDRPGADPHRRPVRRRRLRLQAAASTTETILAALAARAAEAAGQGRADPATDLPPHRRSAHRRASGCGSGASATGGWSPSATTSPCTRSRRAEYAEQTAATTPQPLRRAQPADAPPADAARSAAR